MSSGDDMLFQLENRFGIVRIDAACAVSRGKPNTIARRLNRLTELELLVKETFIAPRCYWHAHRPLGAQGLILASSVLYRCVLAEDRIWTPEGRQGPATLIACDSEREALFVDYGATPRFISKKLARWCSAQNLAGLTALGIVVPTEAKARSIHAAAQDLPLPLRFTVSEDLWSLSCATARR